MTITEVTQNCLLNTSANNEGNYSGRANKRKQERKKVG